MRKRRFFERSQTLNLVILVILVITLALVVTVSAWEKANMHQKVQEVNKIVKKKEKGREKSAEAKKAVMDADLARMNALGLYYEYDKLSLVDTVKAYLNEFGINHSQVAFTYKNLESGETFSMNNRQPMTAGSTYKLPLNMLVVDEVEKGKYNLEQRFDITDTTYEYDREHMAYVNQFAGAMSISEMQEYSLLYSENTPAYALADRLGGMDKAYKKFGRYGKSKSEIKTILEKGNKTTTDYYIQVLDYLWKHKNKYKDILYYIRESFPGDYYKTYLPDITIYQKPGYVREALNVGAIVCEKSPYLISLYTKNLGGSTEESFEISGEGYNQLVGLTYVINEWHRVNQNKD
ncbi:serine hydrolase [Streptococcus pseudoporcinus]|uniref:Lipoprotein n=1 Tax=Streptococcus pseudoporcinus TaxID=361101 RepID=A0A4U9XHZ4_9STRE|nr:serine hydrolase [Streptococcus pseudoporcinus]VTS12794.1 lipoprotein [Streptococcus pseudoporcinus]VUC65647.1 lipoprotein [Streptococcus pseudoporcinus]VUC96568.1 lipoprotein [Streptococcus pseudoporcinus]VUC96960.1 lipoprotein [Streptococcus pseudoporcinus]